MMVMKVVSVEREVLQGGVLGVTSPLDSTVVAFVETRNEPILQIHAQSCSSSIGRRIQRRDEKSGKHDEVITATTCNQCNQ
jgi:hypothetical protein